MLPLLMELRKGGIDPRKPLWSWVDYEQCATVYEQEQPERSK
jgi:hypothetical protein